MWNAFRVGVIVFSAWYWLVEMEFGSISTAWSQWLPAIAVQALAPPHPAFARYYENVHDMRRRLNITFNYIPKHLSHEHCRYLSEAECQRSDEKHGAMQAQRQLNPSIGDFNVLVLFVQFPEDQGKPLGNMSYFNDLFNGAIIDEVNPAGSIREYLRYMSVDQYRVNFILDSAGWQVAPHSAAFYANGTAGKNGVDAMQAVFDWRLSQLDAAKLNWNNFDADGDGKLDHLVVLHSGIPAEFGPLPCSPNYQDRIWSQASADSGDTPWKSTQMNMQLGGYALVSAIGSQGFCENAVTKMGIIQHEFLHGFALPDLYDQDYNNSAGSILIGGIGSYDIMANSYGWTQNPAFPGILSTYSRHLVGWVNPIPITTDGVYPIQSAEVSSMAYKLSANFPANEYLLIENRQPVKWDGTWQSGGIVIYHVDEMAPLQLNRGYPGSPGWPQYHYRVAILQADGRYDIEKGVNLGDVDDLYTKGMSLGSNTTTWPNTASYQGDLTETGITITVLSDPGFIMLFRVDGLGTSLTQSAKAANGGTIQTTAQAQVVQKQYDYHNFTLPLPNADAASSVQNETETTANIDDFGWVMSILTTVAIMLGAWMLLF